MSLSPHNVSRGRRGTRPIRVSVAVYRVLLVAYPEAFRREYGAHMIQVFRDCAREMQQTEGAIGLWRYWLSTLGDLVISAAAERRHGEVHMSRTFWIRLGSLAGIVGGIIAAIVAVLALVMSVLRLLDQQSPLLSPAESATEQLPPVLALLFVLALIGLYVRGGQRAGMLGGIALTLAVVGEAVVGVGNVLQAVVIDGLCNACTYNDPNPYFAMGYRAELLGLLIVAIGMSTYGVVALRRHVLTRSNGLPLAVGLLAIANGWASFIVNYVVIDGTDYAGMQKTSILLALLLLASAIVWALLGATLWSPHDETVAAQTA